MLALKHKIPKYKPLKHNSIEKAKRRKKKTLCRNKEQFNTVSKSTKNLRTLSKHTTNDTKLQLNTN